MILVFEELLETFKFLLNLYIFSSLDVLGGGKEKSISIGLSGGIRVFFNFIYCLSFVSHKSIIFLSKFSSILLPLILFSLILFSLISLPLISFSFSCSLFWIIFSSSTFKQSSTYE